MSKNGNTLKRSASAASSSSATSSSSELTDTDTSDANERKSSVQSMLHGYHDIIYRGHGHGPSDDNQDTPPTVFTALYCEGILIAIKIHGKNTYTFNSTYHCRDKMKFIYVSVTSAAAPDWLCKGWYQPASAVLDIDMNMEDIKNWVKEKKCIFPVIFDTKDVTYSELKSFMEIVSDQCIEEHSITPLMLH
jgi:hypothetical protein